MTIEGEWHKLSVRLPSLLEDEFASALGHWAERGYEVVGREAAALVAAAAELPEGDVLFGLYVTPQELAAAQEAFESAVAVFFPSAPPSISEERIEAGWSERWKEYFDVTEASARLIVRPTWRACGALRERLIIDLDPGAAFGTGSHATTQLCLRALDALCPVPTLLDLGTGSGILAVAAVLLGCPSVFALDLDPLAVEVARENAWFNAVDDIVDVQVGGVDAAGESYAGVVANIMAGPLVEMAAELASRVGSGGWLVLSGVLIEEGQRVRAAYEAEGLHCLGIEEEGEWVCLRFARPASEGDRNENAFAVAERSIASAP